MHVAHTLIPASLRDIGTGAFHLINRDASQEDCTKLTAGAIRVAGVAATILAISAIALVFPPSVAQIGIVLVVGAVYVIDTETFSLFGGSAIATLGLFCLASSVSLVTKGLFASGATSGIIGALMTASGWYMTRFPRDISLNHSPNLLSDKIDDLSESLGTDLYLALT
jgi:hypothetical protein